MIFLVKPEKKTLRDKGTTMVSIMMCYSKCRSIGTKTLTYFAGVTIADKKSFKTWAKVIMPIMFPALYRISKEHWNQTIVALVSTLL
jgi:hypothetical protein